MNVLVTGRAGQLASALGEANTPKGLKIVCVGRPELDLTDAHSVAAAVNRFAPRLVINTAAYTAVDKAEAERDLAFAINGTAAGLLAEACERAHIPIIHISTDYVFDGTKSGPYDENDPVAPASVYGYSKLEGERLVAAACRRHVILRTSWVHSPTGHNFVRTMLRLAQSRSEISVVDDQTGCPTYAPHLADAILSVAAKALTAPGSSESWGTYHVAGSGAATWCELAREIFRLSEELGGPVAHLKAVATADYPTPARRPANSRLDSEKFARVFGARLPDWREGARECLMRLLQAQ